MGDSPPTVTPEMIEAGCVEAGEWESNARSTPECVRAIYLAMKALEPSPSAWRGIVLPCDVRVSPATTIKAGCKLETLISALEMRGMMTPSASAEDAELVERVARAMKPVLFKKPDAAVGPATRHERDFARQMARAAIAAIGEQQASQIAELKAALRPFAKLAEPKTWPDAPGEVGPSQLDVIEGKGGTGELYVAAHFGTDAIVNLWRDDFERALTALQSTTSEEKSA